MKLYVVIGIVIGLLLIRFHFFYSNQPRYTHGQKISFKTLLLSEPRIFGSQQVFTADLASGQKIRIVTSRFPELHYADYLLVSSTLNVKLLNNKHVIYSMYFPKIEQIKNPSNILHTSLGQINILRQKLISLFSTTLPSPYASLLMGIIFGIKESMPKEFSDNLRTSGVFHVIAASGMNVTLIGGFISSFFAFFLKRQIALGISIVGIIFYAVLGGLEPSIIRAAIMGILVFSAQIMGRQTLALNGLFLAGFMMLFLTPGLISDIGFQLSFTATLGILYIQPKFRKKIAGVSDILTTISAQIATLPIILANFGSYSIYSILVNGLVLWTVPILMAVGGIAAIIGLIFMPLGKLIIYLCYPLLVYFESVVNIFGQIGGIITIQRVPWQFIAGYYCFVLSILLIIRRKN